MKEQPLRACLAGATVAALITLPGLGVGSLWDNSETAYGEVAREILLTHNWLIMHFNGVPYFVQPPLYFWFAAILAKVFGLGTFSLRLPSALATIALGGTMGYAVARQAGTRLGIYASMILSSCLMQAVIGRLAVMDALLDLAVAVAILSWFRGMQTGRDRYFVLGSAAVALGFLAKGLVAPVIALLVSGAYYFWNCRHELTRRPSVRAWLAAGLVFAAIALPWPLALVVSYHYHWFPLSNLVGRYTIGRYVGVIENQAGPIWYYIPVILLGFFPWVTFLPMAVVDGIRQLREPASDANAVRLLRLAFAWAVVPLLFFSLAATKLPNYVALEFPALALIAALYFERFMTRHGARSAIVSAAFVPLAIGSVAVAMALFVRNNRLGATTSEILPGLIFPGLVIFLGSLTTAILMTRPSAVRAAPYALALAAAIAIDSAAIIVLPRAEAFKPIPRLAAIIEQKREVDDRVGIQSVPGGNALLFYSRPPVEVLARRSLDRDPTERGMDPRNFDLRLAPRLGDCAARSPGERSDVRTPPPVDRHRLRRRVVPVRRTGMRRRQPGARSEARFEVTRWRVVIALGLLLVAIAAGVDLSRLRGAAPARNAVNLSIFYCAGNAVLHRRNPYAPETIGPCEHRLNAGGSWNDPAYVMPAPLPPYAFPPTPYSRPSITVRPSRSSSGRSPWRSSSRPLRLRISAFPSRRRSPHWHWRMDSWECFSDNSILLPSRCSH